MKKAFTLAVLIVTPSMVFAQGTVAFGNSALIGPVKQWTDANNSTLINVPRSGGYVQLLAAPKGTPLSRPLVSQGPDGLGTVNFNSLSGFQAANLGWAAYATVPISSLTAGQFYDGVVTISNVNVGANADYFLLGWTGNYATIDAAIAATIVGGWTASFLGESVIFTTVTGNPMTTPPGTPVSLSSTFQGMTLGPLCVSSYCIFTSQPLNHTVVQGATATFYVEIIACPKPYYQWYFNGASIPGATYGSLQISNAQLTNAGTYWVVLTNSGWGIHASQSAILTVLTEPIIASTPQSQTACAGSTVSFRVSATGSPPLAYQWFLNTTNALSAGTDPVLRLTNVQPAQAGAYAVVVTNVAGAATSAPAMLSVIPSVERRMVPGLSLLGQPGSLLNLEEANTLDPSPAWVTFDSVILTNTSQWYFDVSMPLPPLRFYRAWQTGRPSVIPTLDLKMVPALTLTGPLGSAVRVDYINQLGPIDAWVALDTVTLTNTSQLYFDVSASGQPTRLYRLVQVP
jgi:hypothetical protein